MRLESRIEEINDRLVAVEKIGDRLSDIESCLEELQRDKGNNAKYRYVKYSSAPSVTLCSLILVFAISLSMIFSDAQINDFNAL